MENTKSGSTMPTELITEKTFYTLGGASVAVLLACWVVMYIAGDSLGPKVYRGIGLGLSELFSIIIMYQKKNRKPIQWLFAFLNGLLIFVNASGFNTITASSVFDKKAKDTSAFHIQHTPKMQFAGLIPLPRMINWWPDETLVTENTALEVRNANLLKENKKLDSLNHQLEKSLSVSANDRQNDLIAKNNKLTDSLNNLLTEIDKARNANAELEKRIESVRAALASCDLNRANEIKKLNVQLETCNSQNSAILAKFRGLQASYQNCQNQMATLNSQLSECKIAYQNCSKKLSSCLNSIPK
jgi:hypothetical protein